MGIVVLYLAVVPIVCYLSFLLSLFLAASPVLSFAVLVVPVLLVLYLLRKRYPHEPLITVWLCGFLPLAIAVLLYFFLTKPPRFL